MPLIQAHFAGFFYVFYFMIYAKSPRAPEQLIDTLESRGLIIKDKERATKYLSLVGYYRLTGYMYHLQERDGTHQFKKGVTFDDIINTYQFDKKLRGLIAEYIERIEVSMRALLTDNYSIVYGFFWYTDKSRYDPPTPIDPDYKAQLEADRKKLPRKHQDTHQYILN